MNFKEIALSIAFICLASTGFGFSLVMPQKANAASLYAENLPHFGINPDQLNMGNTWKSYDIWL